MAFMRIVTEGGKTRAVDLVPDEARLSDVARAKAKLAEKDRNRANDEVFLPVKNTEHAPHPARDAASQKESKDG